MSVALPTGTPSTAIPISRLMRFTAANYFRLIDAGAFSTDDHIELLDGLLVHKMPQNGPHAYSNNRLIKLLIPLLVAPWELRSQSPILLSGDNVPEPDGAVVRGPLSKFLELPPTAADIALLIEVSDTTLDQDRGIKLQLYARDRIPEYWIINLVDNVVEVYTQPKAGKKPSYRQTVTYSAGSSVPLRIDGKHLGEIAVNDLLP